MNQIATKIDQLYAYKQKRLKAQRDVDEMYEEEKRMLSWIQDALEAQGTKLMGGKVAKVELKPKRKPVIEDWGLFHKHILDTGDLSFLEARPKVGTIKEHWQAGETIPGVDALDYTEASLTKA